MMSSTPLAYPPTYLRVTRLARELQAEMRHADHAAARCGALPSDYASHRGLALASVLHRLHHAAGAPAR
jgi:hypothetical protein|tara:strand:+ start:216 stop:422 length:207 start_codon:yes stop_codon:yes gene_type:complete